LLLAVIGQWLAGELAAGDSAAVGERRDEESIDGAVFLKRIEHFLDALIDEGNRADLHADHRRRVSCGGQRLRGRNSGSYRCRR